MGEGRLRAWRICGFVLVGPVVSAHRAPYSFDFVYFGCVELVQFMLRALHSRVEAETIFSPPVCVARLPLGRLNIQHRFEGPSLK